MDIFTYTDYRDYLAYLFKKKQKDNHYFSYQYCANKLNSSKTYLKYVIDKQRHISLSKIPSICQLFNIEDVTYTYFVMLFLENTADDKELKSFFEGVMKRIKMYSERDYEYFSKTISKDGDNIFKNWLKLAVHSSVQLKDFRADPQWIYERLGKPLLVGKEEIENIFKELVTEDAIVMEKEKYRQREFVLAAPSGYENNDFAVYNIGLKKASEVVDNFKYYKPICHFQMLCISLKKDQLDELQKEFISFRDKLIKMGKENKEDCDEIIMINNHYFTLTGPPLE